MKMSIFCRIAYFIEKVSEAAEKERPSQVLSERIECSNSSLGSRDSGDGDEVTCLFNVVDDKDGTIKQSMDVSPTLWIKCGSFDLVLTYVNVPYMNDLELQQVINQEFALPVVCELKGGAAVFIAKPISDDLRDLWLYATLEDKKGKRAVVFIHNVFNARLGSCWSTTPTLHCLSTHLFSKRKLPMIASFHSRLPGLRQLQHQWRGNEEIESLEKSSNCYKKSVHEVKQSASPVNAPLRI
ncbi:hypothetical protein RND71_037435 [Anisodus tanguticus]|uniref:Uncharacterized protein n=1 Tax=Anisodus tanguticus TaxID=243964 RepID=A0AAE1R3D5_9SOLA|nr:hypothetical protein RND71_037435 [Anisodus tanguticus]